MAGGWEGEERRGGEFGRRRLDRSFLKNTLFSLPSSLPPSLLKPYAQESADEVLGFGRNVLPVTEERKGRREGGREGERE
jgi:hypothetical protein